VDNKSLLQECEHAVFYGLNYRYSAHLPLASFFRNISGADLQPDCPFEFFEEIFSAQWLKQRIPQTRIYVSECVIRRFQLRWISFLNFHWFLLYPLEDGEHSFPLKLREGYRLDTARKESRASEEENRISFRQPLFFSVFPTSSAGKQLSPGSLSRLIISEREHHPLNRLDVSDFAAAKELDSLWADLNIFDAAGNINTTCWERNPDAFIWIQEIFIHFGWFPILQIAWESILNTKLPPVLEAAHQRYLELTNFPKKTKTEEWDSRSFADAYLQNRYRPEDIQALWEKLHFPAYRFKVAEEIRSNPNHLIGAALIAIKENFFWQDRLCDSLQDNLDANIQKVVRFLLLIKRITPAFQHGSQLRFISDPHRMLVRNLHLREAATTFGTHVHHRQIFTQLNLAKIDIQLKIDQAVELLWDESESLLLLQPFLFKPPLIESLFPTVTIQLANAVVKVPLVWQQFQVTLNQTRFKFLRKKNRFQVKILLRREQTILFAGEKIEGGNKRYHTVYLPITTAGTATSTTLTWCNRYGATQQAADGYYLRGWLDDRHRLIHDSVQVSAVGSKKSKRIFTNTPDIPSRSQLIDAEEYLVHARYCNSVTLTQNVQDGIINHLLYLPAEKLKNKLIIRHSGKLTEIRKIFKQTLGFVPLCTGALFADSGELQIIIIVEEQYGNITVTRDQKYKIINLKGMAQDRVILIHPEQLRNVLSTHFSHK